MNIVRSLVSTGYSTMTLILCVVVHLTACLNPMVIRQEAILSCWSFMNKHINVYFYTLKIEPGTLSRLRMGTKYWTFFCHYHILLEIG